MIKHCFATTIILFFYLSLLAQENKQAPSTFDDQSMRQLNDIGTSVAATSVAFDFRYEGVKGQPWLFENWQQGTIRITLNERPLSGIKLNINAAEHQVVTQLGNQYIALEYEDIDVINLETKTGSQLFRTYPASKFDMKVPETVLMQVLFEDDSYKIFKSRTKLFYRADYEKVYGNDKRYDEYVDKSEYYVETKKGIEKVKLKRKQLEKLIPALKKNALWKSNEVTETVLVDALEKGAGRPIN